MTIHILALAMIREPGKLNQEYIIIKNESDRTFNLDGCSITVGKGSARPRLVHTFKAGLVLQAQESVRLVTGSSGKSSHGEAPEEPGIRNVHLFLKAPVLDKPGLTLHLMRRQVELCKFTHDPTQPNGLAAAPAPSSQT